MQNLLDRALGKYVILEEIGRGGMAAVYKARDVELDRIVAIKVLSPYLVGEPRLVQRFMGEARLAANLDHPNIVTIYDIGGEGGYYYFVMKYLEGRSLKEILAGRAPLPLEEVLSLVRQLASALDYAHKQKLIHRDVKPGNVIIADDGTAVLTDFGLAKVSENLKLTASGETIGTLEYMAPEQARGDAEERSDVYSLGVMIYEMLTGRLPFQGNNQATLLYQHLHDAPPTLRQWNPNIPPEVEQVVLKAMAKEPAERYGRAGELAQELEQAARKGLALVPSRRAERARQAPRPAAAAQAVPLPAAALPGRRRLVLPKLPPLPHLPPLPPFVRRWWWAFSGGLLLLIAVAIGVVFLIQARGPGGAVAGVPTQGATARPVVVPSALPNRTNYAHLPFISKLTLGPVPEKAQAQLALLCDMGEGAERLARWDQEHGIVPWPGMADSTIASQVSWSPDGEWLVAVISEEGGPNLFQVPLDGKNAQRLSQSPEDKEDPSWSPDGSQVAFADGSPGKRRIFLIQADGSNVREKTPGGSDNWAPAWSPDGLSLAFVSDRDGNTEIYLLDLVHDQTLRLTDDPGEDVYPSWSPDGRQIVWFSNRDGVFRLYAMDPSGQGLHVLFSGISRQMQLARPAWSPQGDWLAFAGQTDQGTLQVLVLNVNTGQLYAGPSGCHWPAWKP